MAATTWHRALLDEACRPYRSAGLFAYFFARGKLDKDPVYRAIIERGLLAGRSHILDLGCGQALLSSWLRAAASLEERGHWPGSLPAAPRPLEIRGIELMARDVARARIALGADANITTGDIRQTDFGTADAVVVLDVLHYMKAQSQREVLERVRRALPVGGLLLMRICDAGAGLRFRYTQWVDKVVMLSRGHSSAATHSRSVGEWEHLLSECGFECEAQPMSQGTPFANVLIIAHAVNQRPG
jgi:cyclopropane fatty-acyl-phospholipid synthase-like methyltransferase